MKRCRRSSAGRQAAGDGGSRRATQGPTPGAGSSARSRAVTFGAVPVPEIAVARVRQFCAQRVPPQARHQVRLEVEADPTAITIVERRAPWHPEYGIEWTRFPIARFRYSAKTKLWTLYWRDRNLRFHRYERLAPSHAIEALVGRVGV